LAVESLESLTLLSGTSSIRIPPSLLHPNEVLNREISGNNGLPMSGSASAMTTVAGSCTEYQITNHRQNKAMVISGDSPTRGLGGRPALKAASVSGASYAKASAAIQTAFNDLTTEVGSPHGETVGHPFSGPNRYAAATKIAATVVSGGAAASLAVNGASRQSGDLTPDARHASTSAATGVAGTPLSEAKTRVNADKAIRMAQSRFTRGQGHGFIGGAAGVKRLQRYAPDRVTSGSQLNQPLGQASADSIAKALGLVKSLCFTEAQYLTFISGQGANGSGNLQSAQLVDESVAILTNTNANPSIRNINDQPTQIVLGSYGLTVNTAGLLESPANAQAPTRQVNAVIAPGGYLSTWAAANGAEASLQMLNRSAYTLQLPHGSAAQHEGGDAELALYLDGRKSAVTGLSVVPSIWEINFALIYVLNPGLAAEMPAHWAPIPRQVVEALKQSDTGQIPFSEYSSYLHYSPDS